jgi:hypothetical protein
MAIQTTFTLTTGYQLDRSLFIDAQASISVPSTEKSPLSDFTLAAAQAPLERKRYLPIMASSEGCRR